MFAEEVDRRESGLQPRDVDIQIHPVDRLDRQPHMIAEDRRGGESGQRFIELLREG
jgi:hypothetical protein